MLAIIFSRRDFRESDQVISLFTQEKGKLELLARGVKKITSKNSAHLEPFSLVDIDIAYGKEIDHLTKVQPIEYFRAIREDFEKSMAAQYVVSLTDKLVQVGEVDERLFNAMMMWFEHINLESSILNLALVDGYIVVLLHCLGFGMSEDNGMEKWQDILRIMEAGDWEAVSESEFDEELHSRIFQFLQYHTERKVVDWKTFDMF